MADEKQLLLNNEENLKEEIKKYKSWFWILASFDILAILLLAIKYFGRFHI